MIKPANSWFSVVSVMPNPETGERVNVAMLFQRGRHLWLEYDADLPRLGCLVERDEIAIYESVLESAKSRLPAELDQVTIEHLFGPHFKVSEPRPLFRDVTRDVIRMLKDKYLRTPGTQHKRSERMQQRVAKRIDDILRDTLPINAVIEKRPTADKLYSRAKEIFDSEVPTLDRAIRFGSRDLLIGGVIIDRSGTLAHARNRIARCGQAFWQYQNAKETLARVLGREVATVGVIFDGFGQKTAAVQSAKDYVRHVWEQDADLVVDVSGPEGEERLVNEVNNLIAP